MAVGSHEADPCSLWVVTDNLFSQGFITSNLVAVSFAPTDSDSDANGELTFGGVDSSKFTGDITFAWVSHPPFLKCSGSHEIFRCSPITRTSPASEFWGIDQTITLGDASILTSTAGIVDTGTTLVLIATGLCIRVYPLNIYLIRCGTRCIQTVSKCYWCSAGRCNWTAQPHLNSISSTPELVFQYQRNILRVDSQCPNLACMYITSSHQTTTT